MMNVLLQPTEQTRSRRKAEVVNELLWVAGPKERSPALAPGPLLTQTGTVFYVASLFVWSTSVTQTPPSVSGTDVDSARFRKGGCVK